MLVATVVLLVRPRAAEVDRAAHRPAQVPQEQTATAAAQGRLAAPTRGQAATVARPAITARQVARLAVAVAVAVLERMPALPSPDMPALRTSGLARLSVLTPKASQCYKMGYSVRQRGAKLAGLEAEAATFYRASLSAK